MRVQASSHKTIDMDKVVYVAPVAKRPALACGGKKLFVP